MILEKKVNLVLLTKTGSKIKNSLASKIIIYGLAGSLMFSGISCSGKSPDDHKNLEKATDKLRAFNNCMSDCMKRYPGTNPSYKRKSTDRCYEVCK